MENNWYVLDHNTEQVGPMSETDARMIAFILFADNFGYNVRQGPFPDYPATGKTWTVQDWVAANVDAPEWTD
jgi:hypothetical protein